MASGFPGSIDNFTDPLTTSALNSPSHAGQHQDLNDAVEKIETYMGLVKVIPTSVSGSGVMLSATGSVSYSAATAVSVNGCFTSGYLRYRVIGQQIPTGNLAGYNMKLRASGADQSGTNYQYTTARLYVNNLIDLYGSGQNNTYLANGGVQNDLFAWSFDIFNPNVNGRTIWTFDASNFEGASAGVRWWSMGGYKADYVADGFTIYPASGNWTGSLAIYGYRN